MQMKSCRTVVKSGLFGALALLCAATSCRMLEAPRAGLKPARFQFLRAAGTRVVNEAGDPVVLKGVNLGNWLLLEMWMLDERDLHDQYTFEKTLAERFGEDGRERLMELYRENWIRERDFEIVRSFGFNVVRVPFHYSLLEDDARPFELRPDAFKWLDRAVEMASRHGLYVILDLHGAPGGQSTDHTTGRKDQNLLWENAEHRARTAWLWGEIAKHFCDEPAVAAYEILNEPFGDYKTDKHLAALSGLADEVYRKIRAADPRHLVIIPGAREGLRFYGTPRERGWENVMFTEHYYPGVFYGAQSIEQHKEHINQTLHWINGYLDEVQTPFLVGEFNVVFRRAGGPTMMRHYFDLFERNGWWGTMWSLKLVSRKGGLGRDNWYCIVNAQPAPDVSFTRSSYEEIEGYMRWLGTMEYAVDEELREVLTSETPPRLRLDEPPIRLSAPCDDAADPWSATDIASLPAGGQRVFSGKHMEIFGGGQDIWNDHDEFRFVWQKAEGDFVLRGDVISLERVHAYSKAGLMVRGGLEPDDPHVLLHVFPDARVMLGWRERKGAMMEEKKFAVREFPIRMRLAREGRKLAVQFAADGEAWQDAASFEFEWLEGACFAGAAVLSHDRRFLAGAQFDGLRLNNQKETE